MATTEEFEATETFFLDNENKNSETFQIRLLLKANKIADTRGFTNMLCSYFYLFNDNEPYNELIIECDILDSTDNKIAIECYLYTKSPSTFIAKSFSIFTKKIGLP